ncbi:MAG: hypothetical protein RSE65_21555 [Hafnia sp.]
MRKIILSLLLLPAVASAASISEYQKACEKQFDKFPDMANCMTKKVRADDFVYSTPQARLYVATATNLSGKVRRGEMYDDEATLALEEKYNELNAQYVSHVKESQQNPVSTFIKKKLDQAGTVQVDVHQK